MSVLTTLPAPIIQMGHVEKIVEMAQNQPHVHQLINQEEAKKSLQTQSEQVAVTDKTAHGRKVMSKNEEEGHRRQQQAATDERRPDNDHEQECDKEVAKSDNPWAGNIVRITV